MSSTRTKKAATGGDGLRMRWQPRRPRAGARDQASWAFTFSTMLPNAAGSLTAMSASTLRSMSIYAFFRPAMNLL